MASTTGISPRQLVYYEKGFLPNNQ